MKLLEGSWVSTKITVNDLYDLSNDQMLELNIFDVEKATAKYTSITSYRTSKDTISYHFGTIELKDKGKMMLKNFNPTSVYREENIRQLTSDILRYTYTVDEKNYDFTFKKQ